MSIFTRKPTNQHTQFQTIADTYKVFGIAVPTRALDIKALVNNEGQSVHSTAHRLALEALNTDQDPDEWYASALDQIKEAQAREALTGAFNRSYTDAVNRSLPKYLEDAANDIGPAVDKTIRRLTTAAKKLPAGAAALDPESNINNDSGSALQEARAALALMGEAASIYQSTYSGEIPVALNAILPIIELPAATVEQVKPSIGEGVAVANRDQLATTYAIRKIAQDAKNDADLTLIDVARGAYDGVTLKLATPKEHSDRRRTAARAHQRETVREGARVVVR